MTVMFVFAALIAANVAYAVRDNHQAEDVQAARDFYRVEHKNTYRAGSIDAKVMEGWL